MGYMDISIGGSDRAADCFYNIVADMVKSLQEELQDPGNEFNTSGTVNVALFFEEVVNPNLSFWAKFVHHDENKMLSLARKTLTNLEKVEISHAEVKEMWETDKNRLWHLGRYHELQKGLQRFIDAAEANF